MKNLIAADIPLTPPEGFTGAKNGAGLLAPGGGIETFSKFVSSAIGLMTIIAIIWFVFTFFIGAIGIISSGGDKQALESARKKITTGGIGLVVTIAAIFIIKLIGYLIGIPNILKIGALFGQITK
jgi:hypothetical protein